MDVDTKRTRFGEDEGPVLLRKLQSEISGFVGVRRGETHWRGGETEMVDGEDEGEVDRAAVRKNGHGV